LSLTSPVYLNGRFTVQPLSGVQRFATETMNAIDRLWSSGRAPFSILAPAGGTGSWDHANLRFREIGRLSGQLWEQLELPRFARDGLLINLGNTAPVRARNQIVVIHDAGVYVTPEAYSPTFRMWNRALHYLLARSSTRIVTVSRFSRGQISRHLGVPEARIDVIPEGGDHALRVEADRSVLARHGLEAGRYVLAVGNLAAHKNLGILGKTARVLHERGVDLAITGGLKSGVFRGGVPVPAPSKYLGRVNDSELRALYEHAACFVFPSRYEGFGLPPLEAMTCGCPVVASSVEAVTEVCADAVFYCSPADADGFADTICRLLDDPELRRNARERGLERARSFSWEHAASAMIDVIDGMRDRSAR
jgi:glycosyltransferase involved in cell wall biosynthesis